MGLAQRDIPKTITGTLRLADGSEVQVAGDPQDFPAYMFMPVYPNDPGLFLPFGSEKKQPTFVGKLVLKPRDESKFLKESEILTDLSFELEPFERMLAKIAYGAALIKHGPEFFEPLVCAFILGREKAVGKYVFGPPPAGGGEKHGYETFMGETHLVQIREHKIAGLRYLIGFVRLFATFGTPTHAVVIGILK
jgi:hypothetical protein